MMTPLEYKREAEKYFGFMEISTYEEFLDKAGYSKHQATGFYSVGISRRAIAFLQSIKDQYKAVHGHYID